MQEPEWSSAERIDSAQGTGAQKKVIDDQVEAVWASFEAQTALCMTEIDLQMLR